MWEKTGGESSMNQGMRNTYTACDETHDGKTNMGDLSIGGRIILKWILKTSGNGLDSTGSG
jgi:hypothetical protein